MTSNQIAFASVKVDQQKADEAERHNKATETLQGIANDLDKDRNRITEEYNREMARLTERQQDLNYTLAKEKNVNELWAKQEQLEIDRLKAESEAAYKENMTWIEQQRVGNELAITAENKRHNEQIEHIDFWKVELADKADKRATYQFEHEINWKAIEFGLAQQNLILKQDELKQRINEFNQNIMLKSMDIQNSWSLGLMNIGVQQRRNNISAETLAWNQKTWEQQFELSKTQEGRQWVQFFLPSADAVVGGATKVLGGMMH